MLQCVILLDGQCIYKVNSIIKKFGYTQSVK